MPINLKTHIQMQSKIMKKRQRKKNNKKRHHQQVWVDINQIV